MKGFIIMSRQRRIFSVKFKSDLVIELIKDEQARDWKKEYLDHTYSVFDARGEDDLKEKPSEERKEKAKYAQKADQLMLQVTESKN